MRSVALPSVSMTVEPLTTHTIFAEHAPFVLRVVQRLGTAPADVEDVAQEVFMVVHRRLHTYDHSSTIRTWLFGIARRVVSDYRRRVRVRREAPHLESSSASSDGTQEAELRKQQLLSHLDEALEELSESKRAVFVLYEMEGVPIDEIAEMLGCPLFTVYSRLREARKNLAAHLARHGHGGTTI